VPKVPGDRSRRCCAGKVPEDQSVPVSLSTDGLAAVCLICHRRRRRKRPDGLISGEIYYSKADLVLILRATRVCRFVCPVFRMLFICVCTLQTPVQRHSLCCRFVTQRCLSLSPIHFVVLSPVSCHLIVLCVSVCLSHFSQNITYLNRMLYCVRVFFQFV